MYGCFSARNTTEQLYVVDPASARRRGQFRPDSRPNARLQLSNRAKSSSPPLLPEPDYLHRIRPARLPNRLAHRDDDDIAGLRDTVVEQYLFGRDHQFLAVMAFVGEREGAHVAHQRGLGERAVLGCECVDRYAGIEA